MQSICTVRPSSPPFRFTSLSQISWASRAVFPFDARGPVSERQYPILRERSVMSSSSSVGRIDVLSMLEGRLEVQEHAELFEKNWHRDVAVKRHDLTVLQMKDVATGRVHLPSGRRNYALRQIEIALVSAVESQFDHDDVIGGVEIDEVPVHVRKRGGVVIDGDANVLAVVFLSGTHVVEVPTITEHGHESGRVLCGGVRKRIQLTDRLLVGGFLRGLGLHCSSSNMDCGLSASDFAGVEQLRFPRDRRTGSACTFGEDPAQLSEILGARPIALKFSGHRQP